MHATMLRRLLPASARLTIRAVHSSKPAAASELESYIDGWMERYQQRGSGGSAETPPPVPPRWFRTLRRDIALRWTGSAAASPGMLPPDSLLELLVRMDEQGQFDATPPVREAIRAKVDPTAAAPKPETLVGCFHCGSPDHWKNECPELAAASGAPATAAAAGASSASEEPELTWQSLANQRSRRRSASDAIASAPPPQSLPPRRTVGGDRGRWGGGSGSGDDDDATTHPYQRQAGDDAPVDVARVEALLERRWRARKQQRFDEADALRQQLRAMDVSVYDRGATWFVGRGSWEGMMSRYERWSTKAPSRSHEREYYYRNRASWRDDAVDDGDSKLEEEALRALREEDLFHGGDGNFEPPSEDSGRRARSLRRARRRGEI